MKEKKWRDFTRIKGYLIKKAESLKKQGWEGGKTKTTWRRMKQTPLRRLGVDLADETNDRNILKRIAPFIRIDMTNSMIKKD